MDDNKIEVKTPGSGQAPPQPSTVGPAVGAAAAHSPGTTIHPTQANDDGDTDSVEPMAAAASVAESAVPAAPEPPAVEPMAAPSEPPAVAEAVSAPPAQPAGPKTAHVVSHPHKQTVGKGFMRELVYLVMLLVVIAAGALGAIYFLKI